MESLNTLVIPYINVIKAFKNLPEVQNGMALGYRDGQDPNGRLRIENKPRSIGYGLGTTGWCVSASQAFLNWAGFRILLETRKAKAKLISIDIQKRHWGACYTGSQNMWHTAILVEDYSCGNKQLFVIDLTCRQFGNAYVDKDIWDFDTWCNTFRAPTDKHVLTDFENKLYDNRPTKTHSPINENISKVIDAMHNITTMSDNERDMLGRFFIQKHDEINQKLIAGTVSDADLKYCRVVNKLLQNLDYCTCPEDSYLVMQFATKQQAKNWINLFIRNKYILPQYTVLSRTIKDSCAFYGYDFNELRKEVISDNNQSTYLILYFEKSKGFDISDFMDNVSHIIPFGIKVSVNDDLSNGSPVYNAGDEIKNHLGQSKETNTIIFKMSIE